MTNIPLALTYDDVLLKPKRSSIRSRKDVDTSTRLTPKISLAVPIVSANMDTVTESEMAIAMAKVGGFGIIHRFLSIEDQVKEVARVKRWANYVVDDPITIFGKNTIGEVRNLMKESDVGGIVVVDEKGKVSGLVSKRDILNESDSQKIFKVMTPVSDLITALPGVGMKKAQRLLHEHRVEKLPLVSRTGKLSGLITLKDIEKSQRFPEATKDKKGRLRIGAAVGVGSDVLDRARALVDAECDVLVIDVAHGHLEIVLKVIRSLKKSFSSVELIAGNVATYEGAKDLVLAGADAIKVGVGPGSMCTTRIVTGFGMPQLSAIMDTVRFCKGKKVPVIADGGIRNSGDIVKALASGASTVMLGGMLGGTKESPGFTVIKNGRKYKVVRGMASLGANVGRDKRENKEAKEDGYSDYVPEGVEALVPYKGSVVDVIDSLIGGLRSGMSYCGAKKVTEMWKKAEFVRITSSGMKESKPHDVAVL